MPPAARLRLNAGLIPNAEPVNAMQPRASTAVAQRAALALAERALREGLPPGVDDYQALLRCPEQGRTVDDATSMLVEQAVGVWARPESETLVSLPRLRFEPFRYQLQAAGTALRAMRGRAILADEVGLGKTIEAGLVTSELRLRGLTARTLILVPVGLVEQWQKELDRKFGLPRCWLRTALQHETGLAEQPLLIASLSTARRAPLPWAASPSAMAPATRTRCADGCRPARRQSRRSCPHRTLPAQPCRIATLCTRRSPSTCTTRSRARQPSLTRSPRHCGTPDPATSACRWSSAAWWPGGGCGTHQGSPPPASGARGGTGRPRRPLRRCLAPRSRRWPQRSASTQPRPPQPPTNCNSTCACHPSSRCDGRGARAALHEDTEPTRVLPRRQMTVTAADPLLGSAPH